MDKLIMKIF